MASIIAAARQRRSGVVSALVLLLLAVVVAQGPVAHARASLPCQVSMTSYHSSPLELGSKAKGDAWANSYCALYMADATIRTELQQTVDNTNSLGSSRIASAAAVPSGLSYYEHTVFCSHHSYSVRTVIEPLYASLRHPNAITCTDDKSTWSTANIFAMSYLIMADSSSPVSTYARHRLYFDLGASMWPELSQKWMIGQYQARGIVFDRVLLWEASPHPGPKIFEKVPPEMFHAYQYFNEPLTADPNSPKNPLNILRKIAHPSDFVVLKVDIDSTPLELSLLKQILGDPALSSRIDELYWEPHFYFPPLATMAPCCFGAKDMALLEAWELLHSLRNRGIRAHGWP